MTETEGNASLKRKINSEGGFEVYGFGYNGFKQLGGHIFEGDKEPPQNSSYCKLISKSSLLYPLALNVPRVSSIGACWSSTFFVKGRYAVLFGRESGNCVPLFIKYLINHLRVILVSILPEKKQQCPICTGHCSSFIYSLQISNWAARLTQPSLK